jgi:hypothetical protein
MGAKDWPNIKYTKRRAKRHINVKGVTKMPCGHEIDEMFRGETEERAKRVAKEQIELQGNGHLRWCKDCKNS